MGSMERFAALNQPPLSPPGWLFPIVWTILFIMMGIASYLVFVSEDSRKSSALIVYAVQLAVNFVWPVLFFNLGVYFAAFLWLLFLWVLILITILLFRRIRTAAAVLLLPYLFWTAFAGYLNLGIALLNR